MTDVYLIPGITFPIERTGWDGDEYWAGLACAFTAWGWRGKLLRAGWSAGDTNIEVCLAEDGAAAGKDVPVQELGRRLAWRIFADQSSRGRLTSVVGHSMGGLVVRAALTGVRTAEPGFPPYLHIDAMVTLATAHRGNRPGRPVAGRDRLGCAGRGGPVMTTTVQRRRRGSGSRRACAA